MVFELLTLDIGWALFSQVPLAFLVGIILNSVSARHGDMVAMLATAGPLFLAFLPSGILFCIVFFEFLV